MTYMLTFICLAQTWEYVDHGTPVWVLGSIALVGSAVCKAIFGSGSKEPASTQPAPSTPTAPAVPSKPDGRQAQEKALYAGDPTRVAIGLLAKLAKADGVVTKADIQVVEGIFQDLGLADADREQAVHLFAAAKDGPLAYRELLGLFAQLSRPGEQIRVNVVLLLLRVAHASGNPSFARARMLLESCEVLGCNYEQCLGRFRATGKEQANQLKTAYEVLGCTPTDSDEHLKERYRQLVRDFHPDTIAGKGLSAEFVRFTEEKFKQIRAAYEYLVEQRK